MHSNGHNTKPLMAAKPKVFYKETVKEHVHSNGHNTKPVMVVNRHNIIIPH